MIIYTYDNEGYYLNSVDIDPMGKVPPGTFDPPPALTGDEVARWDTNRWTVLAERPAPKPQPVIVPQEITRWQALTVLNQAGLLDDVEAYVEAYVGAMADRQAQIDFMAAAVWRRDWSWLGQAATALGLTSEQVDQMFINASAL